MRGSGTADTTSAACISASTDFEGKKDMDDKSKNTLCQLVGTCVVNSFIDKNLSPGKNTVVPTVLFNKSKFKICLYDAEKDILLKCVDRTLKPIFSDFCFGSKFWGSASNAKSDLAICVEGEMLGNYELKNEFGQGAKDPIRISGHNHPQRAELRGGA